MKVYQSPSAKKRGRPTFHLYDKTTKDMIRSYCANGASKKDGEIEILSYGPEHEHNICAACIVAAYRSGKIKFS